jgi:hypothetical protein
MVKVYERKYKMKNLIIALCVIGCSAETTTVTVGNGGELNIAGANNAGSNTGGNASGGTGSTNTGSTNTGGSNTGGVVNAKPTEFQALGSDGFCYKYKNNGLTLGTYLDTDYTIYSFAGEGVRNNDGTCANSPDNLDATKWVNVQNEIFNVSFFNNAKIIIDRNNQVDLIPTAKCIFNIRSNDQFIFEGKNFLIERSKLGKYIDLGIGSYGIFDPVGTGAKITDYMKPIREYFVEQYVTGQPCATM